MKNSELKEKLKNLGSFDEVHDFFVECGYEGDKSELKNKLFKGSEPFKALGNDDLMNVSGGVIGKRVLSAYGGLMMLMGATPLTNSRGYAHKTSVVDSCKKQELKEWRSPIDYMRSQGAKE